MTEKRLLLGPCKIFNYWILNNYFEFLPNMVLKLRHSVGLACVVNHWQMKIFKNFKYSQIFHFRVVSTRLIDFNVLFGHMYDDADKVFNI